MLLDLAIVVGPLALSFDRKVRYVRHWPAAFLSSLIVGVPYAVWDSAMAAKGAWGFSERFAGAFRIFFLPPGELLFFIVVPFSCVFIYEVITAHVPERSSGPGRIPWISAAALLAVGAILLRARLYTSSVMLSAALFLLLALILSPNMLGSRVFWLAVAASYAPFLVANGALTSIPIVTYGEWAIVCPRIFSIPMEDFLYSFSLLGFTFLVYRSLRRSLEIPGPRRGAL